VGSSLFQTLLRKQDITIYHVVHIYQENPALDVSKRRPLPLTSRGNQEDTYCVENRCVRSPLSVVLRLAARPFAPGGGSSYLAATEEYLYYRAWRVVAAGCLGVGTYVGGVASASSGHRSRLSTLDAHPAPTPGVPFLAFRPQYGSTYSPFALCRLCSSERGPTYDTRLPALHSISGYPLMQ
jgi:hypothetical protein